jgi:hypothetical protein
LVLRYGRIGHPVSSLFCGLTNCLQPKYALGLNKLEFLEPLHFSENKALAEGIFLYLAD